MLVTSRRGSWDQHLGVQPLPLDVLKEAGSIALLRKHRPDLSPTDTDLAAIAAELGHLPLALHVAGSFLKLYRADYTPAEYLQELQSTPGVDHELLQGEGISPTGHDQSVFRTIKLSYDQLQAAHDVDALALQALARLAYFAPGVPLPRDLLRATIDDAAAPKLRWSKALRRLVNLGLVEQDGADALQMHRLVGAFVRGVAIDTHAPAAVAKAMPQTANRLNNTGDPRPLLELQPHLRHITDQAKDRAGELSAGLCNTLGFHLQMIGDYAGAQPYYEQALAINTQVLGALLQAQGDLYGAKPYFEQALAIWRQVLGEQHPDTAQSLW